MIGNILHDFSKDTSVDVGGVNLSTSPESTWGEIGFGGSVTWDKKKTFYGEVAYRAAFDGTSDNQGLALTVGLRILW